MGGTDEAELLGAAESHSFKEEHIKVITKVSWRVMPLVWSMWFLAHVARSNLTNIHTVMMDDIKLSEYQFGVSLGAFYISYVVFQMPSNLILERMRVNSWLSIIVLAWGIVTTLSIFTFNAVSLIATRFCLGVAEAGISPGIVYYITLWFGERHRGQKLSVLLTAVPVAYATGGIISSLVLDHMNEVGGLYGWQWLYLFTGIPTIVLSIIFYNFLPNSPQEATFLTEHERKILLFERSIAAAVWSVSQRTSSPLFWTTVCNPRNLLMALCGMFFVAAIAGIDGFAPAIFYELGSPGYSSNFLVAVPNGAAVVCLLLWSYHSARRQEQFWHIFAAMILALVALACSIFFVFSMRLVFVLGLLTIYQASILSGNSVFIAYMCGSVVGSTSIAIGLYYSVSAFGGWLGPYLMGLSRDVVGDHVLSLSLMCGSIALGVGILSILYVTQRNSSNLLTPKIIVREPSAEDIPTTTREESDDKPEGGAILV